MNSKLARKFRLSPLSKNIYNNPFSDLYHRTLTMTWAQFFLMVFGSYFTVNLFFGGCYFLAGPDALDGVTSTTDWKHFQDCFFFSVQTLATIGYGKISPHGTVANLLMTLEALAGLLSLALTTGLLFARFSRPTARVVFSDKALITMSDGVLSVLFRVANRRKNQIVEAKVHIVLVRTEKTLEGEWYRNLYDLKLDRNETPFFSMTWTVMHPIDKTSPLYGITREQMLGHEDLLLVSMTGVDETFSEMVHVRYSYKAEDLVWGAQFEDMLERLPNGQFQVDISKIHQLKPQTNDQTREMTIQ